MVVSNLILYDKDSIPEKIVQRSSWLKAILVDVSTFNTDWSTLDIDIQLQSEVIFKIEGLRNGIVNVFLYPNMMFANNLTPGMNCSYVQVTDDMSSLRVTHMS